MKTMHDYPEPKIEFKGDHHSPFAPGVIDFGARRSSFEWLVAHRAYAAYVMLKYLLICGSITAAAVLIARAKGWI